MSRQRCEGAAGPLPRFTLHDRHCPHLGIMIAC
jgi:hypothetical protein